MLWKEVGNVQKIYVCHDDITGIFSAVYDAWKERRETGDAGIALKGSVEQKLFCEYTECEEREEKVIAVEKMIKNHLGMDAYWKLYNAALSSDPAKGDAILGTMFADRRLKDSTRIMENLTSPSVEKVFALSRKVSNEAHYFKEFLRFKELESGILFARIDPKSQILACIAPHFADRLPLENWLIFDGTHEVFAVHEARKSWFLISGIEADMEILERLSESEMEIQKLWKGFFESISINERESYVRQRQHLPIWYRKNIVEFQN